MRFGTLKHKQKYRHYSPRKRSMSIYNLETPKDKVMGYVWGFGGVILLFFLSGLASIIIGR